MNLCPLRKIILKENQATDFGKCYREQCEWWVVEDRYKETGQCAIWVVSDGLQQLKGIVGDFETMIRNRDKW